MTSFCLEETMFLQGMSNLNEIIEVEFCLDNAITGWL